MTGLSLNELISWVTHGSISAESRRMNGVFLKGFMQDFIQLSRSHETGEMWIRCLENVVTAETLSTWTGGHKAHW